jgi:hypothetical protein
MIDKPPARIVIAKPPAKRPKAVPATVASPPVRIVYAPKQKQRDAWARYLALTGRKE